MTLPTLIKCKHLNNARLFILLAFLPIFVINFTFTNKISEVFELKLRVRLYGKYTRNIVGFDASFSYTYEKEFLHPVVAKYVRRPLGIFSKLFGSTRKFILKGIVVEQKFISYNPNRFETDLELTVSHEMYLMKFNRKDRVFQDKTVVQILKDVIGKKVDYDVAMNPAATFTTVQYNETDYDFLKRFLYYIGGCFIFDSLFHKVKFINDANLYPKSLVLYKMLTRIGGNYNLGITFLDYHYYDKYMLPRKSFAISGLSIPKSIFDIDAILALLKPMNRQSITWTHNVGLLGGDLFMFAHCGHYANNTPVKNQDVFDAYDMENNVGTVCKYGLIYRMEIAASADNKYNKHEYQNVNKVYIIDSSSIVLPEIKTRGFITIPAVVDASSNTPAFKTFDNIVPVKFPFGGKMKIRYSNMFCGSGYGAIFPPRGGEYVLIGFMDDMMSNPIILSHMYKKGLDIPRFNKNVWMLLGKPIGKKKPKAKKGKTLINRLEFNDSPGKEYLKLHTAKDAYIESIRNMNVITNDMLVVGGFKKTYLNGGDMFISIHKALKMYLGPGTIKKYGKQDDGNKKKKKENMKKNLLMEVTKKKLALTIHGEINLSAQKIFISDRTKKEKPKQITNKIGIKVKDFRIDVKKMVIDSEKSGKMVLNKNAFEVKIKQNKIKLAKGLNIAIGTSKIDVTNNKISLKVGSNKLEVGASGFKFQSGGSKVEILPSMVKIKSGSTELMLTPAMGQLKFMQMMIDAKMAMIKASGGLMVM